MKRKTIRSHADFVNSPNDPSVVSNYFIIRVKVAAKQDARYGLIVPKRTFKYAVERNRAKRLLRDWIAFNEHLMLPDADYIFIARAAVLECSREKGRVQMATALKKLMK